MLIDMVTTKKLRKTILLEESESTSLHYVYFMVEGGIKLGAPVKFGVTKNLNNRLSTLQTGNPRPLLVAQKYVFMSSRHAYGVERELKKRFHKSHCHGEWFFISEEIMGLING